MTEFPLRLALPFVPTLPLLPDPELKMSTIALPLILILLHPFAVAKIPYVDKEPTLLIELTPAPVNTADCIAVPPTCPLSSMTLSRAVATPLLLTGGANFTLMTQLPPIASGVAQLFVWVK